MGGILIELRWEDHPLWAAQSSDWDPGLRDGSAVRIHPLSASWLEMGCDQLLAA